MTEPAVLSAEQAAVYLGGPPITARTLLRLAQRKEIGHLRIGRATVFPVTALDAYIETHTQHPEPNPWGLTDGGLRTARQGSPRERVQRRTELLNGQGGPHT